jgi:uncharacterized protein
MNLKIFQDKSDVSLMLTRRIFIYVLFLFMFWITAWLFAITLEQCTTLLSTNQNRFIYWLLVKILIWVIPSWYLITSTGRTISDVMNVHRIRSILLWGGGVGGLLFILTVGSNLFMGHTFISITFSWTFFSAIIVAPVVEEFTFRGAILGGLMKRYTFWYANVLTAVFFLGIHVPGWYFQDTLLSNLTNPIGGALAIFLLGLIFGYVTYKSKSVTSGMLAHFLNNLSNAF